MNTEGTVDTMGKYETVHTNAVRNKVKEDLKKPVTIYNEYRAEVNVKSELYGITTCVIDIPSFKEGRLVFPCGDGDDHKLTLTQQKQLKELLGIN